MTAIENTKMFKDKLNQRIRDLNKKNDELPQDTNSNIDDADMDIEDFIRSERYIINIWGGKQPLHIAAELGRLNMVKKIVEKGYDINVKNNYNWTPLHYATRQGHPLVVQYLVENNAPVNEQDSIGFTPLIWAAIRGHTEIAEYLCLNNANINISSNDNKSPMYYADLYCNPEVIKILEKYSQM